MGWFWADQSAQPVHPVAFTGARPPPSCPMHNVSPSYVADPSRPSACPVKHDAVPASPASSVPSSCPVKHDTPAAAAASSSSSSYISKLNPLNYMPTHISNTRESSQQNVNLSLDRESSTIPRGGGGTWEYPSPQQMYNAMLRKGYTDTPAEHVTAMVAVHNFLNEGAWEEIRGWESRFASGLLPAWQACRRGEEGAERHIALQNLKSGRAEADEPTLLRFMGRPGDLTPKARMLSFLARVRPSHYPDNPPFDRHDWFVARKQPDGSTREVRYVIDYYSGSPEPSGEPVFFLDVRPAIDGPTAACERLMRWGGDVWYRAMGGSIIEQSARQRS